MKTLNCSLILIAATLLVGCKSAYQIQSYQPPPKLLSRDAAVFIGVRPDAYDEPGSGLMAVKTLQNAFQFYAARTQLSGSPVPVEADLTNAAAANCAYLLDPTIIKWEEEPTEWTGKPDVLEMKVQLLQVPDGTVVSAAAFSAKSKWMTLGGDHVEHLLQPLATNWVRSLYEGGEFQAPGATQKAKTK